ncbi:MAG: DUF1501 domain-containing protein [Myxococcota bacterium]
MDRRDFIKLCSLTGLGVASTQVTGSIINEVNAQDADPEAPLFVMVGASGGPDHLLLSSPLGNIDNGSFTPNRDFAPGDVQTAGKNIRFAPPATIDPANGMAIIPETERTGYGQLLFDFQDIATVITGINGQTNGHDTGRRVSSTGILAQNSPALAAIYAGAIAKGKPLAFITHGYYDESRGTEVAKTRLGGGNQLSRVMYPNRINPNDENTTGYHTEATSRRIAEARQARLDKQIANQRLPQILDSMNLLYLARDGVQELRRLNDFLPEERSQGTAGQAETIMAAYMAGLTVSATISRGGFDTHGNGTDPTQRNNMGSLVAGIRRLFELADQYGVRDRMIVVLTGDFGRTPKYNAAIGKDHYPTTQTVVFDGTGRWPGGRQIGGIDDGGRFKKIDPGTLLPVDSGGIEMTHATVHANLRRTLGIADHPLALLAPLQGETGVDLTADVI